MPVDLFEMPQATGASAFVECGTYPTGVLEDGALLISDDESGWDEVIDILSDNRKLQDDWDGQGSKAPTSALIDSAINLVRTLHDCEWRAPDHATVGGSGTILFEWQDDPVTIEIEVITTVVAEVRIFNSLTGRTDCYQLTPSGLYRSRQ